MMIHERNDKILEHMKSDCSNCSGLCCTALFFQKLMAFRKIKYQGNHVQIC